MTYTEIRDELAQILCPHLPRPCDACLDAAYRVVVHRRSIRQALIRFAKQEADLHEPLLCENCGKPMSEHGQMAECHA